MTRLLLAALLTLCTAKAAAAAPGNERQDTATIQHEQQPDTVKKKKGIIIAVVLIVLAALIGAGVYIAVKSSSPMAPVDQFFDGFLDGDWEKVYDSIYWGEEGDDGYMSKSEFLSEVSGEGSDMLSAVGGFVDIKISKVSEGEAYVGDDGLTRKNITIELSAEVMGMSQTEEIDMAVVKSSKKFLFIPAWKIDNQAMGAMF